MPAAQMNSPRLSFASAKKLSSFPARIMPTSERAATYRFTSDPVSQKGGRTNGRCGCDPDERLGPEYHLHAGKAHGRVGLQRLLSLNAFARDVGPIPRIHVYDEPARFSTLDP